MPLFEGRRQAREIQRELQFRKGRAQVNRYIQRCQEARKKYWESGKKALRLGDKRQFQYLAKAYQQALEQVNRWERYLLQLETVSIYKDQAKATIAFMGSMNAMSKTMMAGASPKDISKMQINLEKSLTRAETVDETLSLVMDASSETIFSSDELSEDKIAEIGKAMTGEAVHEEGEAIGDKAGARIDEGLKKIEEEMRKDLK